MSTEKTDKLGTNLVLCSFLYQLNKVPSPPKTIMLNLHQLILQHPALDLESVNTDLNEHQIFCETAITYLHNLCSHPLTQESHTKLISTLIDEVSVYSNNNLVLDSITDRDILEKYLIQFSLKHNLTLKQLKQDIVYLSMCQSISTLSKAKRLKVGEMLVTKQDTLLPGYNGTAPNTSNDCEYTDPETGKLVSYNHVICGLQNAIYKAAKEGVSVVGSTAYSTHSPCVRCVPAALSVCVKRFVYITKYRLTDHLKDLTDNNIVLLQIPQLLVEKYNEYS